MNQLPSSIESYLHETGFSPTELFIIRYMLTEEALTLRQIASKTGRSTGVLDQAMRKLVNKGIVRKEMINESPKFVLGSLNALVQWVQENMKEQRETLLRKYQNFEAFIQNLKVDRTRPEMKYYDGWEGLQQAYRRLLDSKEEIVGFNPVPFAETEDPLRDFRVEYFRERRRNGMFLRVIAHDTPLGRRYEFRDPFEYRKTLLVCPDEYPFTCEKLVTGETVAVIDYARQRACLIKHPELAKTERALFERMWNEIQARQEGEKKIALTKDSSEPPAPTPVPLATRAGSHLREFFLSKSSLVTLGVFAIAAGVITFGLYRHTMKQNTERIREQARAIAIAAAPRFDAEDLDVLQTAEDVQKPEYAKLGKLLNEIRWQQNNVRYAYILRPTSDPKKWTFVADADSLDPEAKIDLNYDGVIDEADELSAPGQVMELCGTDDTSIVYSGQTFVDSQPCEDQWGTWIASMAPIMRQDGSLAGVVSLDIDASEVTRLTAQTFAPFLYFFVLFILFIAIRFSAANKQLVREIFQLLHERKILISLAASLILSAAATFGLYQYTSALNLKRIQDRIQSIAVTGSALLDPADIEVLQVEEDWKRPEWAKVVNTLKDIRLMNQDIVFVYIIRADPVNPQKMQFVSDSHSIDPYANSDDDPSNDSNADYNNDGIINDLDFSNVLQWPGQAYDTAPPEAFIGLTKPSASMPYEDQWGPYISGYAPIKNKAGQSVGALAVDVKTTDLTALNRNTLQPAQYFVALAILFFALSLVMLNPHMLAAVRKRICTKKCLETGALIVMIVIIAGYALHKYRERQEKIAIGERLMTIAATAASQFDPADLDQLRKAGDMKTEAYQRVFQKLKNIKEANSEIIYAYIMRPTNLPDVWEFVADADSNYNVPFWGDFNNDGILTGEDDEIVWPGQQYIPTEASYMRNTLKKPIYNLGNRDQWGLFISGSAPIFNDNGDVIAMIELSVFVDE